jgi:hypothetical protein
MTAHQRGWTLAIVRVGFLGIAIGAGCATGGSAHLPSAQQVATTEDGAWRDCLRFARSWEPASRLSPAPSLSARSVTLGPSCVEPQAH